MKLPFLTSPSRLLPAALLFGCSAFQSLPAQEASGGRQNLLKNGSFEEGQSGWDFTTHHKRGSATVNEAEKRDGKVSIFIENPAADDCFLKQQVAVKPKTRYRITAYIKTREVVGKGAGATISLEGGFEKTEVITGNKSWTKVSFEFDSGAADSIKIGPRLGHYSSPVMGKAWFDDVTLVELGPSRKR